MLIFCVIQFCIQFDYIKSIVYISIIYIYSTVICNFCSFSSHSQYLNWNEKKNKRHILNVCQKIYTLVLKLDDFTCNFDFSKIFKYWPKSYSRKNTLRYTVHVFHFIYQYYLYTFRSPN